MTPSWINPKCFHRLAWFPIAVCLALLICAGSLGCGERLSNEFEISCAHEHLGTGADLQRLISAMEATRIKRMILLGSYETLLVKKKTTDFSSARQNNLLILDAARRFPDRFIPFVLIDTMMDDPLGSLKEYVSMGARGVKLYNGHNKLRIEPADSPLMRPIYEYCEKNGLPVLMHINIRRYPGEVDNICAWYPNLKFIAAHLMCQPSRPDRVERMLERYPNLYTDIGFGHEKFLVSSFRGISEKSEAVRDLMVRFSDRILFGTDVCVSNLDYKTEEYLVNQFSCFRKLLEFKEVRIDVIMNSRKVERLKLNGLHLDRDILKAVYEDNFRRLFEPGHVSKDMD